MSDEDVMKLMAWAFRRGWSEASKILKETTPNLTELDQEFQEALTMWRKK